MKPSHRGAAMGGLLVVALSTAWFVMRDDAADAGLADRRAVPAAGAGAIDPDLALRDREIALKAPPSTAGTESSAAAAAVPVDLFDHDAPLVERIAELDRRARRGDAAAGCQAGFELIRCERAQETRSHFENVEGRVTSFPPRGGLQGAQLDARIDAALERRERHRAVIAACEGVNPREWAAPARYLHAAAQAGHVPSMVQSLAQSQYRPDALVRDPGLIALFRNNAPRYFQALLEAGDPQALHRWSVAWSQTADALPDVLPAQYNRPELAQAMIRQMLERAPGWNDRAPPPDTDPAELRAEATQLYDRFFAPQEARARAERDRMASFKYGDLSAYQCERLAAP